MLPRDMPLSFRKSRRESAFFTNFILPVGGGVLSSVNLCKFGGNKAKYLDGDRLPLLHFDFKTERGELLLAAFCMC